MTTIGATLLDEVRGRWAAEIGPAQLETLEAHLARLTAGISAPDDAPD
jgi:hypothetical protein